MHQAMRCIVKVKNGAPSACQANVFASLRQTIVRFAVWQVAVIVVLMDDVKVCSAIHHRPVFLPGFEDHPIVPTRASNREVRDILEARAWKDEIVAPSPFVQFTISPGAPAQWLNPVALEAQKLSNFQVPTLPDQKKLGQFRCYLLSHLQEIWEEDDVSIDISQQRALVRLATELEDAADERCAKLVDGHLRQMGKSELSGGFRDALIGTDQDDLNRLSECFPALERVALNRRDMRVGEGLGSREQGQSGRHQALSSKGSQVLPGLSLVSVLRLSVPRDRLRATFRSGIMAILSSGSISGRASTVR